MFNVNIHLMTPKFNKSSKLMKSLYLKILYFIFYLCPTGISNKIESNEFDFQINLNFSFISIDTSYTLIVDR